MRTLLLLLAFLPSCSRDADRPLRVAVAANFAVAFAAVAPDVAASTGIVAEAVVGSTGLLAAQIGNGAPFDLLLAADEVRPELLERSGHVAEVGRAVYAGGRLALVGSAVDPARPPAELLVDPRVRRVAIANPAVAPYGAAAVEVLERLGVRDAVEERLVRGENVGQAFSFAHAGSAEIAFVALAQARAAKVPHVEVPASLHAPIRQGAAVLRGPRSAEAAAFLAALVSPAVQRKIESFGYARVD
ncbi:MAG: molybdate ABC transporter substrate-binding protein [Planctomycetota bacterium JB042]